MQNPSPTLTLTEELIRRKSVTPDDQGCQALMIERLRKIGFEITDLPFGDVKNFWAIRGDSGPILCFAGHTDVVPTGSESEWASPPFEPTLKGEFLYGRGAADMKGSLAAMVVATEQFVAENPQHHGRIAYLITSDEEGIAVDGTIKVVKWLKEQNIIPDWCLVGEPSSSERCGDVIKNGRRGSLGCQMTIKGTQGHVAYPHLAENPIHRTAPALSELASTKWDQGNQFFPATSFQISNIQGGTGATNVIPGELTVIFNFRFSTEVTDAELRQRTEAILQKYQLNYTLHWSLSGQPFLTPEGKLVDATVKAIRDVTMQETELSTAGGTSDGRFIAPLGTQVVELGPVNATIHKVDECVNATELGDLTRIYQRVLENLLT